MSYFDVVSFQQECEKMRGSDWIKIGVDTGAGKMALPQSITYGTTIPLSAQKLENLSKVVNESMLWIATIGDRISEFEVFKHGCAHHCCPLESAQQCVESLCCMVTEVTSFTNVRMLREEIDALIQRELRDSQYRSCTTST